MQTTCELQIATAEYLSRYRIRLTFSDECVSIMDFEPFLSKATNPDLTKYRELKNFKRFRIHHGDLMWGDYEMIFPIADLYRGKL
jgi:hypothetical protein